MFNSFVIMNLVAELNYILLYGVYRNPQIIYRTANLIRISNRLWEVNDKIECSKMFCIFFFTVFSPRFWKCSKVFIIYAWHMKFFHVLLKDDWNVIFSDFPRVMTFEMNHYKSSKKWWYFPSKLELFLIIILIIFLLNSS